MKMYGRHDFHESYYDHACSIIQEKDVLEIDIKGNSWTAKFKRWWYNMFLLSYSNNRSRIYYNSSHAMRIERAKQFRRYRSCIHPLSKFRSFWDVWILCVVCLYKVLIHHNTSLIYGEFSLHFHYMAIILEGVIIFDLFINIRTGYVDKRTRKVVLDIHKAIVHYCSMKLFIHVVSAMPIQCLMFIRYGNDIDCMQCKSNKFNCTLKLISVISLFRVFELSTFLTRERASFKVTCFLRLLRIGLLGLFTMLQFINFSDTISLLNIIYKGHVDENSYYGLVIRIKYAAENPPTDLKFFAFDFARVCKSLLLFNFGFTMKKFYLDKLCSLLAYIIANVFYMWSLMECFTCISRETFQQDELMNNKDITLNLIKCRQLPDKVCSKVTQYFEFNMTKLYQVEKQNCLFRALPLVLKREIALNCYSRLIMRIPYFTDWPLKVVEQLIFMLKEEVYLKHAAVAEAWVQGIGLIIIDVGVMAVYSTQNEEMGHLIDGDYFGELSLVTDKEIRMSYVTAVTACRVLILEKGQFRKFMRLYPILFFDMKRELRKKYVTELQRSNNNGEDEQRVFNKFKQINTS